MAMLKMIIMKNDINNDNSSSKKHKKDDEKDINIGDNDNDNIDIDTHNNYSNRSAYHSSHHNYYITLMQVAVCPRLCFILRSFSLPGLSPPSLISFASSVTSPSTHPSLLHFLLRLPLPASIPSWSPPCFRVLSFVHFYSVSLLRFFAVLAV